MPSPGVCRQGEIAYTAYLFSERKGRVWVGALLSTARVVSLVLAGILMTIATVLIAFGQIESRALFRIGHR